MNIELTNERQTDVHYEYDIEGLTDEDVEALKKYALERIAKDNKELINYALNCILRDYVEGLAQKVDGLKKIVKKKKVAKKI
jgi:hypothetical protein